MNVLSSTKRFTHYAIIMLTLAIITACSNQLKPTDYPPALFSELDNTSAFYLQKADEVHQTVSLPWQLIALQSLVSENKPIMANSIIEYLQGQPLTAEQQSALTVFSAETLSQQNQTNDALTVLSGLDSKPLSKMGQIYFLKLQSRLQIAAQDPLNASNTLLLLTPLLAPAETQHYHDLLFAQLVLLPADVLMPPTEPEAQTTTEPPVIEQIVDLPPLSEAIEQPLPAVTEQPSPALDPIKQGWYELASLYQHYQLRPNQLKRSLSLWQENNTTHPGFAVMPTQLTNLPELSPYQPENIAVLIPLSGRFQQQGQAIQYGLLHAYYQQKAENSAASTPVKLHFFDTQLESMEAIVAQFKAQQIDFVIGPLLKSNVETFLPLVPQIPVLALNSFPKQSDYESSTLEPEQSEETTDSSTAEPLEHPLTTYQDTSIAWHYAFPISPEEEARQAARFIFAQEHKKPLVIAPDSNYGLRISKAFDQEWQSLSAGTRSPVESYFFANNVQLAPFIANALQTEKSQRRIEQMKMLTQLPLETKLRSRRDVDAIYIISKRDELLMLKAFIDVSISPFAATIPLYASSRSHLTDQHNKELSKLTFSDVSLLIEKGNKTLREVQQVWSKQSFASLRLFALGHDSYRLIPQLIELQNNDDYTYKGLIGQITLDQHNNIQAVLNWARYQQGQLVEITTPTTTEK